jgi:hypothetical protein
MAAIASKAAKGSRVSSVSVVIEVSPDCTDPRSVSSETFNDEQSESAINVCVASIAPAVGIDSSLRGHQPEKSQNRSVRVSSEKIAV